MRRTTMQKNPVRTSTRRVREKTEGASQERSEIRKDIRAIWWPDETGGSAGGGRSR